MEGGSMGGGQASTGLLRSIQQVITHVHAHTLRALYILNMNVHQIKVTSGWASQLNKQFGEITYQSEITNKPSQALCMYSNGNLEWLDKRQSQQTAQSPSSRLRERRRARARERRKGWHMPPTQSRAHLLACCRLEMNYRTSTLLSLLQGKMRIRAWCCKLDAYIYICPSWSWVSGTRFDHSYGSFNGLY